MMIGNSSLQSVRQRASGWWKLVYREGESILEWYMTTSVLGGNPLCC